MSSKQKILVVEDDPAVLFGVRDFLETHGYQVEEAVDLRAAEEAFRNHRPDAVVLDYLLPDGDTLELVSRLKQRDESVPILILTGHASIDLAVRAIKEGADHFLTKPVDLPSLLVLLQREIENHRNQRKHLADRHRDERVGPMDPFIGGSAAIRRLEDQARRVVAADASLLIRGETGTGKGVLARWLHASSPRAGEPFVDLNCAGLSHDLLESELFGHERGAFTGASRTKPGLLEIVDRGTMFLDEIGDMDPQIQPKLLTVLDEKRFRRVGEVRDRKVDIRLMAATNQDLSELVSLKRFRADLYFRINTITLFVPPLRERKEDIVPLARTVLDRIARDLSRRTMSLSPEAESSLSSYSWPGNVRELRNVLERAVLLSSRNVLHPQDLRFETRSVQDMGATDTSLTLTELERLHIERVLTEEGGNVERAAAKLGLARSSLYYKLKRFGKLPSSS